MRLGLSVAALSALSTLSSACFKLDSFVWNARHCSVVDGSDVDLCERQKVCTPCDEPYPFAKFGLPADDIEQRPIDIGGGDSNDAYFVPGSTRSDVTVLYAHGNFASIEHYWNRVALLHELGVNVFAIDYRGFGKSTVDVEPSEQEFMADVQKARAALAEEGALPAPATAAAIAIMGFSAGALGAVEIARTSDNCALVLENPWPSVQVFADDSTFIGTPQTFVSAGAWDNISKMPEVTEPLLHLHGTEDATVRLELGQRLFAAANDPKQLVVVDGAGHGNFGEDVPTVLGAEYGERIAAHLDEHCR